MAVWFGISADRSGDSKTRKAWETKFKIHWKLMNQTHAQIFLPSEKLFSLHFSEEK